MCLPTPFSATKATLAVNKRRLSSLARKDTNMQAERQNPDGKKQHMAVSREKKTKTQLGLKGLV